MVYISEDVLVASVFAFALSPPVSSIGCCGLERCPGGVVSFVGQL